MVKIPETEAIWVTGDLNGHIEEGSLEALVTGKYGVGARDEGGDRIADFAAVKGAPVVNTYYKKRLTRRATNISGGQNTQVDYVMCRRKELKQVQDCSAKRTCGQTA